MTPVSVGCEAVVFPLQSKFGAVQKKETKRRVSDPMHGAHDADVLDEEEFYDLGHVGLPAARQRYTQALAAKLAPLLEEDH